MTASIRVGDTVEFTPRNATTRHRITGHVVALKQITEQGTGRPDPPVAQVATSDGLITCVSADRISRL